jgi:hypothetical protein
VTLHTYGGSIEIPEPVIQVVAEENWKTIQSGYSMWTGYSEFSVTIRIGDVVLLERTSNDNDLEDNEDMTLEKLREQTVNEFATRLKEVLGL